LFYVIICLYRVNVLFCCYGTQVALNRNIKFASAFHFKVRYVWQRTRFRIGAQQGVKNRGRQ
jgi:hypothetical protein